MVLVVVPWLDCLQLQIQQLQQLLLLLLLQ
jgi:hypothetical protein